MALEDTSDIGFLRFKSEVLVHFTGPESAPKTIILRNPAITSNNGQVHHVNIFDCVSNI